ncbi:MAG: sensor domain-containing protein, partial [Ktedonobacteraceae bacterium]|nr:sensor domain-containing protein [Ktedonobacteraceae bacterium]
MTTAKRSIYRVAQEEQSYKNMLYLLLSFPLGLCYFVILVPTIMLGIGTLIIWIGVPTLILVMIAWWAAAAFERQHAMSLLQVSIAPMGSAAPDTMNWWQTLPTRLSNRMTWKTLLYLLLKFPFGLVSFILVTVLPVLTIAITLVALVIYVITAPFVALVAAIRGVPRPGRSLQQYFVFAASAFGLSLIT